MRNELEQVRQSARPTIIGDNTSGVHNKFMESLLENIERFIYESMGEPQL